MGSPRVRVPGTTSGFTDGRRSREHPSAAPGLRVASNVNTGVESWLVASVFFDRDMRGQL